MPAAVPTVHADRAHLGWDNAIEPVLELAPGDSVEVEMRDASGGQLTPASSAADVARLDTGRANPLTGPIAVAGAEPGDTLVVRVDAVEGAGWGWTALIPGFGLLADDFPDPYLHLSTYDSAVAFTPEIRLPLRPFVGTIGVALAAPGRHDVIPPRHVGGNLDLRDLTVGTTLYLPVEVAGALLSIGDTHAAQGDGEVCGTAVETPAQVRLTVDVRRDLAVRRPQLDVDLRDLSAGPHHVTTGVGPDLMACARDGVRDLVEHVGRAYGLEPELAYCLCSVAAHLRVSEVVDAPNWVVSAYLPLSIFR